MKTAQSPQEPNPEEVIRKCVGILSEHFESVQVLASNVRPDGKTSFTQWGSGNYYARVQMAQTFIDRDRSEHVAEFIVRGQGD